MNFYSWCVIASIDLSQSKGFISQIYLVLWVMFTNGRYLMENPWKLCRISIKLDIYIYWEMMLFKIRTHNILYQKFWIKKLITKKYHWSDKNQKSKILSKLAQFLTKSSLKHKQKIIKWTQQEPETWLTKCKKENSKSLLNQKESYRKRGVSNWIDKTKMKGSLKWRVSKKWKMIRFSMRC